MERVFLMYDGVERFCTELNNDALEGLCDCVSEGVVQFLEEKAELCFRTPPYNHKRIGLFLGHG